MKTKYTLVRSRRRTIALSVYADASLVVRAPLRTSRSFIDTFIDRNIEWVRRTIARVRRLPRAQNHEFLDGEEFLYLGNKYTLRLLAKVHDKLQFSNQFILDGELQHQGRDLFTKWYKTEAKNVIGERVAHFAKRNDLEYGTLKITSAKSRWGSCSNAGNLNFTWRLIMAPLSVVDYVVCHELAHLEHKNHGKKFWSSVAAMYPDYLEARKWLRHNGGLLRL